MRVPSSFPARLLPRSRDRAIHNPRRTSISAPGRFYGNRYGNRTSVAACCFASFTLTGISPDVSCKLTRFQLNRPVLPITPALFHSRPFLFRKHAQPFQPVTIALISPARSSRRTHADNARGSCGIMLIDRRVLRLSIFPPSEPIFVSRPLRSSAEKLRVAIRCDSTENHRGEIAAIAERPRIGIRAKIRRGVRSDSRKAEVAGGSAASLNTPALSPTCA